MAIFQSCLFQKLAWTKIHWILAKCSFHYFLYPKCNEGGFWSARAAITKRHKLGGLKKRNGFSLSCRDCDQDATRPVSGQRSFWLAVDLVLVFSHGRKRSRKKANSLGCLLIKSLIPFWGSFMTSPVRLSPKSPKCHLVGSKDFNVWTQSIRRKVISVFYACKNTLPWKNIFRNLI